MKKIKSIILLLLVGLIGFFSNNTNAFASSEPSTIKSGDAIITKDYLSGAPTVYYKPLANGIWVFCENANKTYLSGYTMKKYTKVDDGFIFILENKPNTGDSQKDYYIMQLAVWWYQDILDNKNTNLSSTFKKYVLDNASSNTTCQKVYALVKGASSYKQEKNYYLNFNSNNINFTLKDGNYVSDTITVKYNVSSINNVTLTNAPTNAKIINEKNNNGVKTFNVSVPKSSIKSGESVSFSIEVKGSYGIKSAYDYYYNSEWQKVLYGSAFTTSNTLSDKKTVTVKRDVESFKVKISKTDITGQNEVPGATLTLTGDNNVNMTWVSTSEKHEVTLLPGVYKLKEVNAPNGYVLSTDTITFKLDENGKLYQKDSSGNYVKVDYIKMVNEKIKEYTVKISKTEENGKGEIPGATLTLTGDNNVNLTWTTTSEKHEVTLKPGVYKLKETKAPEGYILSQEVVTFKVDEDGKIYQKDANGKYQKVSYVTFVNEKVKEYIVKISKTDITGQNEVPGATLNIKGDNNVDITWVSTTKKHEVSLLPGEYSLTETIAPKGYVLSKETIYFKVDNKGRIYQKNVVGEYTKVDYIKMVNLEKDAIIVSKLNSKTHDYVTGAKLKIENKKGELIASWTTSNESYYISLEEDEYILSEMQAPDGFELNSEKIYFKVDSEGKLYVKNSNGEYELANGIIMYNNPKEEDVVVIDDVPKTGLSSILTYVSGASLLAAGAFMLKKNEKKN